VDDYYSWRKVAGSEVVKYWANETEMDFCNNTDGLLYFDDQLSAFVRLSFGVFRRHSNAWAGVAHKKWNVHKLRV